MKKYKIPLVLTFDGFAVVEAKGEDEAEQIALWNIGATIGNVYNGGNDKIIDYDFDFHGYAERRSNESIENCDEITEFKNENKKIENIFIDIAKQCSDCGEIIDNLRGLLTCHEITENDYNYLIKNFDDLLKKYNL